MRIACDPMVVGAARAYAVAMCEKVLDDERCDDLALAVSELITNAIRHGEAPVDLEVLPRDDGVRIEVSDGSPEPLALTEPDELATGRRGLQLVDAVAVRWGWRRTEQGKLVWCEL